MEPVEPEFNVQRDLEYIRNELIAKTIKGTYVKFSRQLNALSVIDGPKSQFERYWISKYCRRPEELKLIMEALRNLFSTGLTPPEKMLKMIEDSNDFESEKLKARLILKPNKPRK